jgi:beta-lactamase superfamily II metal-dependent hydrolase
MSVLRVTIIDVGWGDSIFIESIDNDDRPHYALIDSNDEGDRTTATFTFLKKFFRLSNEKLKEKWPNFDFVMLSHDHTDHASGLRKILEKFATQRFWYPKVPEVEASSLGVLQRYANSAAGRRRIGFHQAVDSSRNLPGSPLLGDVSIDVLWPYDETIDLHNPNNNSIVLTLTLGNVTFVLTGDAELEVWDQIAGDIPDTTRVFKLPHHGSENGTYDQASDHGPWLDRVEQFDEKVLLAISCHPTFPRGFPSHPHPHAEVLSEIERRDLTFYRTDEHYHLTFETKGTEVTAQWSHP